MKHVGRLVGTVLVAVAVLGCSSPSSKGDASTQDAADQTQGDVGPDLRLSDVAPDLAADTPREAGPQDTADASDDTLPDLLPDVAPEAATDTAADAPPDAPPDIAPVDSVPDTCQPECEGKVCGDDGCGGSCGTCDEHFACEAGACAYQPWCGDATCDVDLVEDCTTCPADCPCGCGETCSTGVCTFTACDGKECGEDGCGGTCGTCDWGTCEDGICYVLADYCLQSNPATVDFGTVYEGTSTSLAVLVENCGTGTVKVVDVGLTPGGNPGFEVDPASLPGPLPLTLGPGDGFILSVTFSPAQPSEEVDGVPVPNTAVLAVDTIAPTLHHEIPVSGVALDDCPVAVIGCSGLIDESCVGVVGEPGPQLYGDQSYAPNGTVTAWKWTLDSPGTPFQPSDDVPNPLFQCPWGSVMMVYLTVFNQNGEASCKPAEQGVGCWK